MPAREYVLGFLLAVVIGCTPKFVKLDPARVRRVDVSLVGGGRLVCPQAGRPELRALVTYDDRTSFATRSRSNPNGLLRPSDLEWATSIGKIGADAQLALPELRLWYDHEIAVNASIRGRPEMVGGLALVPSFTCNGQSMHGGAMGGRGQHVEVALAYVETRLNGRLVLVRVQARGAGTEYYLLDRKGPAAARLVVSAQGGPGAPGRDGSSGSNGVSGMSGISGTPGSTCSNGSNGGDGSDGGNGGNGSDGGNGGNGGDGGEVTILYPSAFPELARVVEVVVDGGAAGRAGRGGSGGSGGRGGSGGSGGSAGSTTSFDGKSCSTSSGSTGRSGNDGQSGSSGRDGRAGRAGNPGTVIKQDIEVGPTFAEEVGLGWKIVPPS
jgi:hypothetical protein